MSTNLSKQKRDDLLAKISAIRAYISAAPQDENTGSLLTYLSKLERDVNGKKYGLVFEEHQEAIDTVLAEHTPVLTEEPGLLIDNGGDMNFLLEGDNLAALQLLEKTHRGRIDLIYIDPPYNTGAKDWKYDNNYVDTNDTFRHSKWLSMMKKRLSIAKGLLSPRGVFICAIDDNEVHTISLMLDELFGDSYEHHCITVIHNPNGTQGKNFSYCHEYAIFVVPKGEKLIGMENRADTPDVRPLRDVSKGNNMRTDAKNCFYPILVKDSCIIGFGDVCPEEYHPQSANILREDGVLEIYPIDANGNERKWVFARQSVESIKDDLKVEWNKKRGIYDIIRHKTHFTYKTVWQRKEYNANIFGTKILKKIIPDCDFNFPKSLYNVEECIKCVLLKDHATILDFFAGSGTTGHAVMKLNSQDNTHRRFILCTNNENNICRNVTYERIKRVIEREGYAASLKYYRIDYVPINEQLYYEYADELLRHVRELVELENGVNFIENAEIAIVLTDEELVDFIARPEAFSKCHTLYLGHDILPTGEQDAAIKERGIRVNIIPDYYYRELEG